MVPSYFPVTSEYPKVIKVFFIFPVPDEYDWGRHAIRKTSSKISN